MPPETKGYSEEHGNEQIKFYDPQNCFVQCQNIRRMVLINIFLLL